jgi:hypothetical protein
MALDLVHDSSFQEDDVRLAVLVVCSVEPAPVKARGRECRTARTPLQVRAGARAWSGVALVLVRLHPGQQVAYLGLDLGDSLVGERVQPGLDVGRQRLDALA